MKHLREGNVAWFPVATAALVGAIAASSGCSPPEPVEVVFVLDCSLSSERYRTDAIKTVRRVASALDPVLDRIAVYRLTTDIYPLYPRREPSGRDLEALLKEYSGWRTQDHEGTAYGLALDTAYEEAQRGARDGFKVAIAILGDGEDEPVKGPLKNFDPDNPGHWVDKYRDFAKSGYLAFMFLDPSRQSHFKPITDLMPPEKLLVLPPVGVGQQKGADSLARLIQRG